MKYGYNDGARGPMGTYVGVVHLFTGGATPLCGKMQHYIPCGKGEGPVCKTCQRKAGVTYTFDTQKGYHVEAHHD
jgi:hypothetical protein